MVYRQQRFQSRSRNSESNSGKIAREGEREQTTKMAKGSGGTRTGGKEKYLLRGKPTQPRGGGFLSNCL